MIPELMITKNGVETEISSHKGLNFTGLTTQSPQSITSYQSNNIRDGSTQSGPILFGLRTATAEFYFAGEDESDFQLACQEVWRLFFSRDPIILRSSEMPGLILNVIAKPFDVTRINWSDMTFSIEFDIPSGFRQSIEYSDKMSFLFKQGISQIGMNIPIDKELNYNFNSTEFKVYNPSDVVIDPYFQKHDLKIYIQGIGKPVILNKTNDYGVELNKSISSEDKLVWNGVHPTLNGEPCERDTNHGHIKLEQGWNDISVTGLTDIDLTFSFPFLYF